MIYQDQDRSPNRTGNSDRKSMLPPVLVAIAAIALITTLSPRSSDMRNEPGRYATHPIAPGPIPVTERRPARAHLGLVCNLSGRTSLRGAHLRPRSVPIRPPARLAPHTVELVGTGRQGPSWCRAQRLRRRPTPTLNGLEKVASSAAYRRRIRRSFSSGFSGQKVRHTLQYKAYCFATGIVDTSTRRTGRRSVGHRSPAFFGSSSFIKRPSR